MVLKAAQLERQPPILNRIPRGPAPQVLVAAVCHGQAVATCDDRVIGHADAALFGHEMDTVCLDDTAGLATRGSGAS